MSSIAGRRGRLVGFVKPGLLKADQTFIDLGGYRQFDYPNSVLVHATDAVNMHAAEILAPNDAKGLTGQVVAK